MIVLVPIHTMNKKMTPEQILEICIAVARMLQGLSASWVPKFEKALANPTFSKNLLALIENSGNSPEVRARQFGTFKHLKGGETLDGKDFVKVCRAKIRNGGNEALGNEDYLFLIKPENWHLLQVGDDRIIVFFGTEYKVGARTYIRALRRDDEIPGFVEESLDLASEFDQRFEVAILSVSALTVVG